MEVVYFSKNPQAILEKMDYSRLGSNVAIKTHFGERVSTTYLSPETIRPFYEKLISLGKKATFVETTVLYNSPRRTATGHIDLAKMHGYDFAPIDIIDGENGKHFLEVPVKDGIVNRAYIGRGLKKYDSLLVLTHFKGHAFAGFGGTLKNMAMGLGSRIGKLHMHADIKPVINHTICTGCGLCIKSCEVNAISFFDNKKPSVDKKKCVGCGMCIAVCPVDAPQTPLWGTGAINLQKKIVDYCGAAISVLPKERIVYVNFLTNITPECDCMAVKQKPIVEDIGVVFGYDPVAVDVASLDIVMKETNGEFAKINSVDKSVQVDYAAEKGIGKKEYNLVIL